MSHIRAAHDMQTLLALPVATMIQADRALTDVHRTLVGQAFDPAGADQYGARTLTLQRGPGGPDDAWSEVHVPLIALHPLGTLAIESAEARFAIELVRHEVGTASTARPTSALLGRPTTPRERRRKTHTAASIEVLETVRRASQPEGVKRIADRLGRAFAATEAASLRGSNT